MTPAARLGPALIDRGVGASLARLHDSDDTAALAGLLAPRPMDAVRGALAGEAATPGTAT